MSLKEKLKPSSDHYSTEEISEDLNIPIEMIRKMEKLGIITPIPSNNNYYSFKTVKFIEMYWSANAERMLNAK
jgi:Zn-dependent peptidase ImmA (M78 family)